MTSIPATRINSIELVETSLKVLDSQGYNVTALWAEHNAWLLTLDSREPTDEDRKWATQLPEPSSITEHFNAGEPELLTPARCHVGRQYTLTPGQRELLREKYGMTPTRTVKAIQVDLFASEEVIWSLVLKCAEYVDKQDHRRRHVLNEVVLQPAADFFRDADLKDKEKEEKREEREGSKTPRVKSATTMALAYLCK